jgi:hypothetical protein
VAVVVAAGLALFWMARGDGGHDESGAAPGGSSTIDAVPHTLTSIPFCDETSDELGDSFDGPQQPDASFWTDEQRVADYGAMVEATYGSSAAWAGWLIAPDRSLVFRFSDIDPERDAAIGDLVEGYPHSFRQVGFTAAERQRASDRLIEAWEDAGQGQGLSGIAVDGLNPLVQIDLSDHDGVESFAQRIGLEPPYDVYCINPRAVDSANTG